MSKVALSEGHEETDSLNALDISSKSLDFLMMEKVHILHAYLREIIFALD